MPNKRAIGKLKLSPKKMRLYSPAAMTNAILAVKEGELNMNQASIKYGVPEPTLRHRLSGRVLSSKSGPAPFFTNEEESFLFDHFSKMSKLGYGQSRLDVLNFATQYAVQLGLKKDDEKDLSLKWFYGFRRRWPELSVNKPRSSKEVQAKTSSSDVISSYFEELQSIIQKYELEDKPQCIYNVDEICLETNPTPNNIQKKRSAQPVTLFGCGNAYGLQMPPYFVFPAKRMKKKLLKGGTACADGTVNESGLSDSVIFQNYFQKHFLKYAQGRYDDQHLLILYDGHKYQITIPLIEWAKKYKIILFAFPAHTSHLLQPINVECFGSFQHIYNSECEKYIRLDSGDSINQNNICELACKAYSVALSPDSLKSAFERTGIYPLN